MSKAMSAQERKLDAAEYVIGTLSEVERSAFEVSIESDKKTKADVHFWERVFGALNASVSPEAPADDVWARIEKSLDEELSAAGVTQSSGGVGAVGESASAATAATKASTPANDNLMDGLLRSRRRWRFGAIAASLIAVGLGTYIYANNLLPVSADQGQQVAVLDGKNYVAVVNANGDEPSLVINIDAETGVVTVRSVGVSRPQGKSLELWYVPEGQKAVSVGLVGEGEVDLKDLTAKPGDLLAVSVEPPGGSPTGTATGPVIYTGKLIKDPASN